MIFVEHVKDDYDHLDGNAALIASFLIGTEKEEEHYIFAGEKHFKNIDNLLSEKLMLAKKLINIPIKPYNSFVREYKYVFSDFNIVLKIFNFARKENIKEISFLYTTTFLLYYIKIFMLLFPDIKVCCTIHGELEKVDFKKYSNSFQKNKIIMSLYAIFLGLGIPLRLFTPKNLKYLVYGESIKQNLLQIISKISNHIIAIPHPMLWESSVPPKNNFEKIEFVIPGIIAPRKNQNYVENLINDLHIEKMKQDFRISFAGKILSNEFYNKMKEIDFINKNSLNNKMLTIEARNLLINNATYSVYAYSLDSYKLIASGAFLDAINFEKPMIAIKNSYINYYFEKYGNIGYLCNSYEELRAKVVDLINNFPEQEYKEQVRNIQKIKKLETINTISEIIRKAIGR